MRTFANNTEGGLGAGMIALYIIIGIVGFIVTIYLIWVQVQIKNNTEETKDTLKEILKQMRLGKKDDNEKPKVQDLTPELKELEKTKLAELFAMNKAGKLFPDKAKEKEKDK